ncbi:hypothetical protein SAEN8230_19435 [Salmonella enterica subsp. arizonae]
MRMVGIVVTSRVEEVRRPHPGRIITGVIVQLSGAKFQTGAGRGITLLDKIPQFLSQRWILDSGVLHLKADLTQVWLAGQGGNRCAGNAFADHMNEVPPDRDGGGFAAQRVNNWLIAGIGGLRYRHPALLRARGVIFDGIEVDVQHWHAGEHNHQQRGVHQVLGPYQGQRGFVAFIGPLTSGL